eukprot:7388125-Prymnesium_polylepis.1
MGVTDCSARHTGQRQDLHQLDVGLLWVALSPISCLSLSPVLPSFCDLLLATWQPYWQPAATSCGDQLATAVARTYMYTPRLATLLPTHWRPLATPGDLVIWRPGDRWRPSGNFCWRPCMLATGCTASRQKAYFFLEKLSFSTSLSLGNPRRLIDIGHMAMID